MDWNKYLDEISKTKSIDSNEIKGKLVDCGKPGLSGTTVSFKEEFNQCILGRYLYTMIFECEYHLNKEKLINLAHQ